MSENTTETMTDLFVPTYLGDGEWEIEAENGTWEVSSTSADEQVGEDDSLLVEGPNHHHGQVWCDTLDEAIAHVQAYGRDRRRTA